MNILVTGGCGFIGSHYIKLIRQKRPDDLIVNIDLLTYAGTLENLNNSQYDCNYRFYRVDINEKNIIDELVKEHKITHIVNFAAESHVDRSINSAQAFIDTNVSGTLALLEVAVKNNIQKFLQVSTDEVYGSIPPGYWANESSPLNPSNPYAASKAAAEHLCRAFANTYKLNVTITRSCNNFGPNQSPEKFIPNSIIKAINGQPIPVYGDGLNQRTWIYVKDNCEAIDNILLNGISDTYNISSPYLMTNLDVLKEIQLAISRMLGTPIKWEYIEDRKGHDRRYAINNYKYTKDFNKTFEGAYFEEDLMQTIIWYMINKDWINKSLERLSINKE